MKIFEIEDYIVYLEHSEPKYFLAISHINGSSLYEIINNSKSHSKIILNTFVKDELRLWMDLNGLKMTGEKIIVGHVDDKLDIFFELFELKK